MKEEWKNLLTGRQLNNWTNRQSIRSLDKLAGQKNSLKDRRTEQLTQTLKQPDWQTKLRT